jgi:type I restriction-modification system DNA methylase subunit
MALRKSQLYSSLWSNCDELRGGMDASPYKGYVLVLPFIKYVKVRQIKRGMMQELLAGRVRLV